MSLLTMMGIRPSGLYHGQPGGSLAPFVSWAVRLYFK